MRRGEIWIGSAKSDYAGKPRPLLIIQGHWYYNTQSVTICPITSDLIEGVELRPILYPNETNGLLIMSQLMVDKITTIPEGKLSKLIGVIAQEQLETIDKLLIRFFDININKL